MEDKQFWQLMQILLPRAVTNIQPSIFTETEELSLLNQFQQLD